MTFPDYQLLEGTPEALRAGLAALDALPVDEAFPAPSGYAPPTCETTLARPCEATGPGTYAKGVPRTLRFTPAPPGTGWVFDRTDLPLQLPVAAALANVQSASRAIVLRAGGDANRVRMSEHVICHRLGLGLDNVRVSLDSEDPPLFDVGSMPIVEALQAAGRAPQPSAPLRFYTVREPVAWCNPATGAVLAFEPALDGDRLLHLDVAIDFPNAIGRQRIQFDLHEEAFAHGAHARTNCRASEMRLARLLGWLLPRYRSLGYTDQNILVADKRGYVNPPRPELTLPDGKSLEAVWHRACLDLVAALSLLPQGRPAGTIRSYKAGHVMDVLFLTQLLGRQAFTDL